jgi:hypothetical protein
MKSVSVTGLVLKAKGILQGRDINRNEEENKLGELHEREAGDGDMK